MDRINAIQMAKSLRDEGKTLKQVSFALLRNGYGSNKTGKRLHPSAICHMIRKSEANGPTTRKAKSRASKVNMTTKGKTIVIRITLE